MASEKYFKKFASAFTAINPANMPGSVQEITLIVTNVIGFKVSAYAEVPYMNDVNGVETLGTIRCRIQAVDIDSSTITLKVAPQNAQLDAPHQKVQQLMPKRIQAGDIVQPRQPKPNLKGDVLSFAYEVEPINAIRVMTVDESGNYVAGGGGGGGGGGDATAANQVDGNNRLASIDGKLTGQATAARQDAQTAELQSASASLDAIEAAVTGTLTTTGLTDTQLRAAPVVVDATTTTAEVGSPLDNNGNILGGLIRVVKTFDSAGNVINTQYLDTVTDAPQTLPVGTTQLTKISGLSVYATPMIDSTDNIFLRELTYSPGGINVFFVDTLLDGQTPYSPVGEVEPYAGRFKEYSSVNEFKVTANLAAGADITHSYTVAAPNGMNLSQIEASSSGQIRVEVVVDGNTKFVKFSSAASLNVTIELSEPIFVANGQIVEVIIENMEVTGQNDVYSTTSGKVL